MFAVVGMSPNEWRCLRKSDTKQQHWKHQSHDGDGTPLDESVSCKRRWSRCNNK